jgi:hypothetical protein
MTIPVEIMLRGDPRVYAETIEHPGELSSWTASDMRSVIERLLRLVHRLLQPGVPDGPVQLRGMNWIVSPYQQGVVIAIETHSASVVAGPFDAPAASVESLVVGALGSVPPGTVVH